MKRISLLVTPALAAIVAMGAFASVSVAAPGSHASIRAATTRTTVTVNEDPAEFYGPVTCTVTRKVSKKFPGGEDKEKCVSATTLTNMVPGPNQTVFNGFNGNDEPIAFTEWNSDFDGKKDTSDYTYSVANNLKSFKITAVYAVEEEPAPE
jgi:hypothetical protein